MTRFRFTRLCVLCAVFLSRGVPASAQGGWPKPATVERDKVELCGQVYLFSPPHIRAAASSIPNLIRAKKWEEAVRAVQVLLDAYPPMRSPK